MCGILAIICNDRISDLNKILEIAKFLEKRGPDNTHCLMTSNSLFSFYRLSINDTSEQGNQPMMSENGKIIMMCNGEIYNHKELESKYNLALKSKSDCEVIIRLYEYFLKTGTDKEVSFVNTVKELYGVFAIVLMDGDEVFLSRDRIGVRPLYYGITKEGFNLGIASVPNVLVPFCNDIRFFPPGKTAVCKKNDLCLKYIWIDNIVIPPRLNDGIRELRESLENAVKMRLMSDRPMGCLLSGGLDSSIIAYLLAKNLGGKNVRTYSIGMEGSPDLFYARRVATFLDTDHKEFTFTEDEGISVIPEIVKVLGSYDITTIRASVGMYLLCKHIERLGKDVVIFSGEGSDEILEGYLYFHNAPSPEEGETESLRLIENLHMYDVLRADRCISSCGLEPRVPFLDRNVVNTAIALHPTLKVPLQRNNSKIEKYVLRKAFEGCLPDDVIWRRKDGFSDSVSGRTKKWSEHIQERVDRIIPDYLYDKSYPSKEAQYYRMIFTNLFPGYNPIIPYWLPKFCGDVKDPSGRLMKAFGEK